MTINLRIAFSPSEFPRAMPHPLSVRLSLGRFQAAASTIGCEAKGI
jgi:hypothetical protein